MIRNLIKSKISKMSDKCNEIASAFNGELKIKIK